ncbi:MAG: hypothetical protein ACP6IT_01085 [Candidatus Thorarchaeota archaeon]
MKSSRRRSPWAYDETEIHCPRCGSNRVVRVLDRWAMSRGVQVFKCAACGKKFYDRGVDDYRPTY